MPWFDFSLSVEVENEDVFKQLVDELLCLACGIRQLDISDVDKYHECPRPFVASHKPSPDLDEAPAEVTGYMVDPHLQIAIAEDGLKASEWPP